MAAPMPRTPPVTRATCPLMSAMSSLPLVGRSSRWSSAISDEVHTVANSRHILQPLRMICHRTSPGGDSDTPTGGGRRAPAVGAQDDRAIAAEPHVNLEGPRHGRLPQGRRL